MVGPQIAFATRNDIGLAVRYRIAILTCTCTHELGVLADYNSAVVKAVCEMPNFPAIRYANQIPPAATKAFSHAMI